MKGTRHTTEEKICLLREADRDEKTTQELCRELLWTLREARFVVRGYRQEYNLERSHSPLGLSEFQGLATRQGPFPDSGSALLSLSQGWTTETESNKMNKALGLTPPMVQKGACSHSSTINPDSPYLPYD